MLVDSNILIYAINRRSSKHVTAQNFLQNNIGDLEVAHQNIFETLRVLTHPKFPSSMKIQDALNAINNITKTCRVIFPDEKTYSITLFLIKKNALVSDQIFDAYLAATALSNGIAVIATDNIRDFKKFKEIKLINPFLQNHN
ncbi:MAG: PIN domain-containing protein [Candidatus Levybacteria bacterium]|nr:PIN domain-containing protein [Candidatus Levybacteria bacterium]